MAGHIRWGILGPGKIARKFATGLAAVPDAELLACASRDAGRAQAFAREFSVPRVHNSYADMLNDPDIDAVYVATPHPFHHDHTLACLDHGKAALCEKPFALNAGQAEAMVARAAERRVFLMEAMWTRFLPRMRKAREMVAAGAIGAPRLWRADFCFRGEWRPEGRLLAPELGGGGLLDIGVYTLSLASFFFGPPVEVKATAHIGATGVDEVMALSTRHAGGELASLTCAVRLTLPPVAALYGTEGWIAFPDAWWNLGGLTLHSGDKVEEIDCGDTGNGYNHEAAEVGRCLREGLVESPVMPWAETIAVQKAMDEARRQVGLAYPQETGNGTGNG